MQEFHANRIAALIEQLIEFKMQCARPDDLEAIRRNLAEAIERLVEQEPKDE
jgi:hypothetical protein